MNENQGTNRAPDVRPREDQPKIVAEMPGDEEMRQNLKELQEHDGFPGTCGGL